VDVSALRFIFPAKAINWPMMGLPFVGIAPNMLVLIVTVVREGPHAETTLKEFVSPSLLVEILGGMLALSWCSALVPATRASRIDPAIVLRNS